MTMGSAKTVLVSDTSRNTALRLAPLAALAAVLSLSACASSPTPTDVISIDRTQGSQQNISSLTAVINANPSDPEGYNVRGAAYGKAGESRKALDDFNTALKLNPRFYQAYANRALVYRTINRNNEALINDVI